VGPVGSRAEAPHGWSPGRARVVLLDLDKTLVNVEDHVDYCAALTEARRAVGPVPDVPVPPTHWGTCALEAMRLLLALSGRPDLWARASQTIERYELAGARRSRAMGGLGPFLEALGHRPRAVVTLLGPRAAAAVLARHGIRVDHLVARDPRRRIKPHPDQVVEALRLLGAQPWEAVMVGDSEWDLAAARAAGVPFVALSLGREGHGFGEVTTVRDLGEAAALLRDPEAAAPV
jgi:HAD superfamily hydrolase (TIGR01509 family)